MAKNKICHGCIYNNNGWCKVKKTNKNLKDLIKCESKKTDNLKQLEEYLKQKEFELGIDNSEYNKGFVKGLQIALAVIKR